ncbi:hypothetical protein F5879DRAFT_960182 [Lentinula edodes]|nr:hypothetical protein F5879DRAFT_960182 [Lentinula edodes]
MGNSFPIRFLMYGHLLAFALRACVANLIYPTFLDIEYSMKFSNYLSAKITLHQLQNHICLSSSELLSGQYSFTDSDPSMPLIHPYLQSP